MDKKNHLQKLNKKLPTKKKNEISQQSCNHKFFSSLHQIYTIVKKEMLTRKNVQAKIHAH